MGEEDHACAALSGPHIEPERIRRKRDKALFTGARRRPSGRLEVCRQAFRQCRLARAGEAPYVGPGRGRVGCESPGHRGLRSIGLPQLVATDAQVQPGGGVVGPTAFLPTAATPRGGAPDREGLTVWLPARRVGFALVVVRRRPG